jgi:hypothetical protein
MQLCIIMIRGSVVGIATAYGPRGRISSPSMIKNFHFSLSSRPALGSTLPPLLWVLEALSREVRRPGHEADRHFQLVPRSIKCGPGNPFKCLYIRNLKFRIREASEAIGLSYHTGRKRRRRLNIYRLRWAWKINCRAIRVS